MRRIRLPKIYFLYPCFLILLLCTTNIKAQNLADAQKAISLIQKNISTSGLTQADLQNSRVSDVYYDKISGATLVYLQQTYQGIDVDKHIKVFAFKNESLISALGDRYAIPAINSGLTARPLTATPKISAGDAVRAAAANVNIILSSLASPVSIKQDATKQTNFGNIGNVPNVVAKLIWSADQKSTPIKSFSKGISLCWVVDIAPEDSINAYRVKVDAASGKVLGKENYTVSCDITTKPAKKPLFTVINAQENKYNATGNAGGAGINSASYRVVKFPVEAPSFPGGAPTIHTNPWELAGTNNDATTLKWNYDGTNTFDSTRGNNVFAQINWNNPESYTPLNNGAAYSTTPSPDLTFDYNPDFSKQPTDSVNRNFATTNLFYWNNIMHDVSYQYGFNETAGNFQQNNLSRGGAGGDYVVAFAQDGKGVAPYTGNANFYTPVDGTRPRMRMYLFDATASTTTPSLIINAPAKLAGGKQSVEGGFSTNNLLADVGPVTANVVLYNSDSPSPHNGCSIPNNAADLKGKIALIYRGTCAFTDKVSNAQTAGAVGVIMVDSIAGETPFIMGGTADTIIIPAVMIARETGDSIKRALDTNTTVNATLKAAVGIKLDGDLDAGVMCHEYTHGISNRFTGGPSNASCLFNGEEMGEGWSDYDALMFTTNWTKAKVTDGTKARPVGTYVEGQPNNGPGIRTYPYSTDMSIDKWTYGMINSTQAEVHNVGEIWCTILWDMTWNIIQIDGINNDIFNANAAGGNSVALKLVYEGMKLQKCSPGFVDGRDAILKADTLLYSGKYSCAIWNAFTKRGVGLFASEGSSDVVGDETADFSDNGLIITKHVDKDSASQGDILSYSIGVKAAAACSSAPIAGLVVDTLPKNITYVPGSGGVYNPTNKTVTFAGITLNSGDSATYTFKATINSGTYFAADTLFYDAPSADSISKLWDTYPADYAWTSIDLGSSTPDYWYYSGDENIATDNRLATVKTYVVPGMQTTLSFLNYTSMYYGEFGLNGGVVEISADKGTTWQDLGPYMSGLAYTATISDPSSAIVGRKAFSGYNFYGVTKINLSAFSGKNVKIRFRYVTSDNSGGVNGSSGWLIQNILLKAVPAVNNIAESYGIGDSLNAVSSAYTVIKSSVLPVTWNDFTATKQKNTALLQWSTLQEINSASFDIERSSNGINFTKLGAQQAAGNSASKNNYSFIDETPLQGTNIYRIKQTDRDGKFNYSVYRPLTFDDIKEMFSVTPNPAKDKVKVTVTSNTKLLHIYLMSSSGQQLKSFEMNGETKDINLSSLASGVYHVIVKDDNGVSYKQKIVIQ